MYSNNLSLKPTVTWTKQNCLVVLMSLVIVWLAIGAASVRSSLAILVLFVALTTMIATYAILLRSGAGRRFDFLVENFADRVALSGQSRLVTLWMVAALSIGISLLHYYAFDGFTLLRALESEDNLKVAIIRQGASDIPGLMKYLRAFAIGSLFPIGLLLAVMLRKPLLMLAFALFGIFYAVNLMQKSGPIVIVLPTLLYLIITKQYRRASIWGTIVAIVVLVMGFVSNPQLQPTLIKRTFHSVRLLSFDIPAKLPLSAESKIEESKMGESKRREANERKPKVAAEGGDPRVEDGFFRLSRGLFQRVVIVPGQVVAQWVDLIPSRIPFGLGCGYRFSAPLLGCEFQNYAHIIYDELYPQYTAIGLRGSANAASMMVGYANFGVLGVVLYGIAQAIIALGLRQIFFRDPDLTLPVNATYVFFLSSSDLLTMLLSGGWALAVLLFVTMGRRSI